MIIIPPITAKQIISVWKFTANTHMIMMQTTKTHHPKQPRRKLETCSNHCSVCCHTVNISGCANQAWHTPVSQTATAEGKLVCFLLQHRPQRASFKGQRSCGGRMVLTGYVMHDLVAIHQRHCKKNKARFSHHTHYEEWGKCGTQRSRHKVEKEGGREEFNRSVSPQTSLTGVEVELLPGTFVYTYKEEQTKKTKELMIRPIPWHFSDIPHNWSHFLTHKL